MAPEQISGQPVDGRADLFSAGVLLYELLSGHRPFTGESPTAVAYQIMHSTPNPLRDELPDLPDAVNQIVSRALQKNADERYSRARDMSSDLQAVKMMLDLPLRPDGKADTIAAEDVTQELYATAISKNSLAEAKLHADPVETVVRAPVATGSTRGFRPAWVIGGMFVVVSAIAGYMAMRGGGEVVDPAAGTAGAESAEATAASAGNDPAPVVPPPAVLDSIEVSSEPAGAAIVLNGADTGRVTPATVSLGGVVPSEIELVLDGYDPVSASISQEDLEAGTKALALLPVERPVRLTVSGSYPFEVVRGSQVLSSAAMSHELTVNPGGAAVVARSAEYLLEFRLSINYRRSSATLTVPESGTLAVFGSSEFNACTVLVDGQDLGPPPIPNKALAAGRHAVVMRCPDGREQTQNATVEAGVRLQVNFQGGTR
jgi:hypothetical protein